MGESRLQKLEVPAIARNRKFTEKEKRERIESLAELISFQPDDNLCKDPVI
jgi:hypothetical protein